MYLLSSDRDTLTGMRLAGIDGVLVSTEEEFETKTAAAVSDPEIGILLVTKTLSDLYPSRVLELKKNKNLIVTQIPDMKNPSVPGDSITKYVQNAIGIKVE